MVLATYYHIAENFWPMKIFFTKFGACCTHLHCMIGFSILWKDSLRNGHFLSIRESFLPQKFPAIWYYYIWNGIRVNPIALLCVNTNLHHNLHFVLDINLQRVSYSQVGVWVIHMQYHYDGTSINKQSLNSFKFETLHANVINGA